MQARVCAQRLKRERGVWLLLANSPRSRPQRGLRTHAPMCPRRSGLRCAAVQSSPLVALRRLHPIDQLMESPIEKTGKASDLFDRARAKKEKL